MQIGIRSQKNLNNDCKKATGCSNSRWQSGTSWSDLEDKSDDGEIIESEDSVDGQSSPERCDDASSIVRNQTTSADDELTVGSGKESDSEDSSEHDNMILRPEARSQEKMAVCGLPRVPHHQKHVHVIFDTPMKTNWCCKNHSK